MNNQTCRIVWCTNPRHGRKTVSSAAESSRRIESWAARFCQQIVPSPLVSTLYEPSLGAFRWQERPLEQSDKEGLSVWGIPSLWAVVIALQLPAAWKESFVCRTQHNSVLIKHVSLAATGSVGPGIHQSWVFVWTVWRLQWNTASWIPCPNDACMAWVSN